MTEEQIGESIPCGPDPEPHVEAIREYVDAGFDHVAVVQAPPDQEAFFDLWEREIRPALG